MMDWEKELKVIFEDPLLADVTAPKKKATSSDRLIAGFQQITAFVEAHHRLPQDSDDREERTLYNQWQGLQKDPAKRKRCIPYDTLNLLTKEESSSTVSDPTVAYQTPQNELDSIFNDPLFADVKEDNGLFDIPEYMRKKLDERREADYVAQRVKCEDFAVFENGFKTVHEGLKAGKYKLIKFREEHVAKGRYFVDNGMLVYLAGLDQVEKNRHGKKNSRTRCVYENGMESGIYMQTLCKNLYANGYTVQDCSAVADDYLKKQFMVTNEDVESGLIYVLRSLSTRPEIASIPNLYKIGFTTTSLEARIAHAKDEPTYLCADVKVVATWKVYNVKSSTFESLIHKLFDDVQLQVTVDGKTPKEWFIVPLEVICQAVNYMTQGKTVMFDANLQQLIDLSE